MPSSKKRKTKQVEVPEPEMKSYNPTKSKVGKFIILIIAIGMFLGMLIAAIYGMIQVL